MSVCEPCNNESWVVSAGGYCEEPSHHANYWICLHPNGQRPDHKFHGERCRCHCGRLFCRSHARPHARANGRALVDCFPNLAGGTAGPAFSGALAMRGGQPFDDEEEAVVCDRLTKFLAGVAIGWDALGAALGPEGLTPHLRPGDPATPELTWMDAPDGRGVRLARAFFTAERLDRTALLVLHTLAAVPYFAELRATMGGDARLAEPGTSRSFDWSEAEGWVEVRPPAANLQAHWPVAPSAMSEPELRALAALAAGGRTLVTDAVVRGVTRLADTVRAHDAFSPRTMDERALAEWLVTGELDTRGMAMAEAVIR